MPFKLRHITAVSLGMLQLDCISLDPNCHSQELRLSHEVAPQQETDVFDPARTTSRPISTVMKGYAASGQIPDATLFCCFPPCFSRLRKVQMFVKQTCLWEKFLFVLWTAHRFNCANLGLHHKQVKQTNTSVRSSSQEKDPVKIRQRWKHQLSVIVYCCFRTIDSWSNTKPPAFHWSLLRPWLCCEPPDFVLEWLSDYLAFILITLCCEWTWALCLSSSSPVTKQPCDSLNMSTADAILLTMLWNTDNNP